MIAPVPILVVTRDFPPRGGAGTQRWAKFAKFLPDHGYDPVLVTSGGEGRTPPDETLVEPAHARLRIYRIASGGDARRPLARRLLERGGFRPDDEHWTVAALPVALRVARDHGVRAVVTSVSPYALSAVGPAVRSALQAPWVLDLRDPWALDGWRSHATWLHARRDLALMTRALRAADLVIANTPEARRQFVELGARNVHVIPNGFDPADLPPTTLQLSSDAFHLAHIGTLHRPGPEPGPALRRTLRHAWRRIDRSGRSGRYLFAAMAAVRRTRPDLFALLRLDLVGQVHPDHARLAEELGLGSRIAAHGYLTHRRALEVLCASHAVFVPLHGIRDNRPAAIVPGKLYEALASERFVLGCLPEGDAATLVRRLDAGAVCRPDDVPAITAQLVRLLEAWRDGHARPGARRLAMARWTRATLARQLAERLDDLLGKARPRPRPGPTAATRHRQHEPQLEGAC